jgi:GNAT superfamily N-acetyltransferase
MYQESKTLICRFLMKSPMQMLSSVLDHIPLSPFEVLTFFSLQVVGIPNNRPTIFNVSIRVGSEADLESLSHCVNKPARFLARFRMGDQCLLAFEGNEVVGFLWFSVRNPYEEELTGYRVSVPDNTVYSYDEYVSPTHRCKGILSQMFTVLYEWMNQNNKNTIKILIIDDNEVSWQAHIKKGFVPIDKILYLRIFSWRYYRENPAERFSSESKNMK